MRKLDKSNLEDILTLTPTQEGMLFHYLETPDKPLYLEQLSIQIAGEINYTHFESAWNSVVETNEMLRVVFRWEKMEKPFQAILKKHKPTIRYFDLSNTPHLDQKNQLERIKIDDRKEFFDLQEVPFRITLIKLEKEKSTLIISNHHILYDGWSNGIILTDFLNTYNYIIHSKKLHSIKRTKFKEYIKWLNSQETVKCKTFWKDYLLDYEQITEFSIKKRQKNSFSSITHFSVPIEKATREQIEVFCGMYKLTIATLLYGAWGLLLQKYNNTDDILFGTTVSGRTSEIIGIEEIVGLFINTIPLRIQSTKEKKLINWLQQLNHSIIFREQYEHVSLPEIKEFSENSNNDILFDTVLVIENYPIPLGKNLVEDKNHLSIKGYSIFETTNFDLTVGITLNDEINIEFIYNANCYEETDIVRLSEHYIHIIKEMITNTCEDIALLNIIPEAEKDKILYEFNSNESTKHRYQTVTETLFIQGEKKPNQSILIGKSPDNNNQNNKQDFIQLTYKVLMNQSLELSYLLMEKGVKPGVIVGMLVKPSIEMIVGILGILNAGGAYLPISVQLPAERINYIVKDSGITTLLTSTGKTQINLENTKKVAQICCRKLNHQTQQNNLPRKRIKITSSDLAYIIYTSGTTGRAKGVMVEHRNLSAYIHAFNQEFHLKENDIAIQQASYAFDAFVEEMYPILQVGGKLLIADNETTRDINNLTRFIFQQQVTFISCSPLLLNELNQFPQQLKSLRLIISGGDRLKAEHISNLFEMRDIYNTYGPTESTVCATYYSCPKESTHQSDIPIGKPINGYQVYILDRNGNLLPIGPSGELCVTGNGITRGYMNRPELTFEKFSLSTSCSGISFLSDSTLYRTGDLARWQPDGNIQFMGRIDRQIKIRGYRIELGEIETCLTQLENVKKAIVIPREEKGEDEKYLCAYIIPSEGIDGKTYSMEQIKTHLTQILPEYMIPTYFIPLKTFPLTDNGKLNLKALPEPKIERSNRYIPPQNEIENRLVDIWSNLLSKDNIHETQLRSTIGILDNFFELGGHSLRAIRLTGKLHKEFEVEIPLEELFKHPTIKEISRYIQKKHKQLYQSIQPAEKKEYYPLISTQEQFFLIQQLNPEVVSYNMFDAIVMEGVYSKEKFKRIFTQIIARHESLRTTFRLIEGKPVQRIHEDGKFELKWLGTASSNQTNETKLLPSIEQLVKKFVHPFDLMQLPLLRIGIIEINPEKHVLVFDAHHIIMDGYSISVLIKEFMTLYQEKTLPPLSIQFKDYSQWLLAQKKIKTSIKGKVIHNPESLREGLNLPTDYPKPATQTFEGTTFRFEVEKEKKEALTQLAISEGTTLYAVLLSTFSILLSKLGGQESITIGSPAAGRELPELENQIGLYIKTVVMRNYPNYEKSFAQFLSEVKANTLEVYANQNYLYEEQLDTIAINTETGQNPLFEVMFALQNLDIPEIQIPGMKISSAAIENNTTKFDLTLQCEEEETLIFKWEYSIHLFKKETIQRYTQYYKKILSIILTNPQIKIAQIEILPKEEKQLILYEFNSTAGIYPKDKTLHQLFQNREKLNPDTIALVGHTPQLSSETKLFEAHVSYNQLHRYSGQIAARFREIGVNNNIIVALQIEQNLDMIPIILGILKAGGAYLPIDPTHPKDRSEFMLNDSGTKIHITAENITHLPLNPQPSDTQTYLEEPVIQNSTDTISPSDMAYIIYTSGTTGKPKAVVISHENVSPLLHYGYNCLGITENQKTVQNLSYTFDWSVWEIFITLTTGATLHIIPPELRLDINAYINYIQRQDISIFHITPTQWQYFLEMDQQLKSLRYLFLGAEALSYNLVKRSISRLDNNCRVFNMYGPTEATIISSLLEIDRNRLESWKNATGISIGQPTGNSMLLIVDKNRELSPLRVPGELLIGGDGTAKGYLNNPELTAEKFIILSGKSYMIYWTNSSKRFYKTGDQCRWQIDGNIEFLGRIDKQVKIRGFRIELGEIENRLKQHTKIYEAVVVAKSEANKSEKFLCAYIIFKGNHSWEKTITEELKLYLAQTLPGYMIPSFFIEIEKLPLTPNGKLDQNALPEPQVEAKLHRKHPENDIEKRLVDIWSYVLGRNEIHVQQLRSTIGTHDNFFEIGGHSLRAVSLSGKIHQEFKVELPLGELFKTPTIKGIAQYIEKTETYKFQPINPIEKKEYYPLLSTQKQFYIFQQLNPFEIGYNMFDAMQINGRYSAEQFETVLNQIAQRHESLRTTFHTIKGEPVQRIHPKGKIQIQFLGKTEDKNDDKIWHSEPVISTIKKYIRPFDLSKLPLFRIGILTLTEEKHLMIFDAHHIIMDGVSTGILIKEFQEITQGKHFPPLIIQYKDYCQWLTKKVKLIIPQTTHSKKTASQINLPLDYTRPATQSYEGHSLEFCLRKTETENLRQLALKQETTLYTVLLSAFTIFLARISNQEHITVGSPVAGREHPDLESQIGLYIKTVVLNNSPFGEKSFLNYLGEVKTTVLDAIQNQTHANENQLTTQSNYYGNNQNALFNVLFALQNLDIPEIQTEGLQFTRGKIDNPTAKFDIALQCEEQDTLVFKLEYGILLFKKETIQRYANYLKKLISSILEKPEQKIAEIEILTKEEKHLVLYEFNNTIREYPRNKTIQDAYNQQVEQTPDTISLAGRIYGTKPDITVAEHHLSHRQLNEQSLQLSILLTKNGIGNQSIVAVKMERSVEMTIVLLGILQTGGAYMPIDPEYPEERINYMLKDSKADVCLTRLENETSFPPQANTNYRKSPSTDFYMQSSPATSLAYIIYTSGTTGKPKGVMVEHRSVMRLVMNPDYIRITPQDRVLPSGAAAFDISTFEIWAPLLNGAMLYQAPRETFLHPHLVTNEIIRQSISILHLIPQLFNQLATQSLDGIARLKHFLIGGDLVQPLYINKLHETNPSLKILHMYGPTENTTFSTYYQVETQFENTIPIGKPISNSFVIIQDLYNRIQPIGVAGELCVGGDGLSRGYLNKPELTAEKFTFQFRKDPSKQHSPTYSLNHSILYRTGDLARWQPDGNIQFLGREDHQVKIRGIRIELGEINNQILTYPAVKDAIVIAQTTFINDKLLCAYIVPHQSAEKSTINSLENEIREYLSKKIPGYMIPSFFIELDHLPMTAHGKVDRKALPQPEIFSNTEYEPPVDEKEKQMVNIWSEVLGIEPTKIGVTDSFFRLGGHSLKAAALAGQIYKELSVEITLSEIFKTPTIRELCQYIGHATKRSYSSIEREEKKEYYPLSSAQERIYILQQMDEQGNGISYNMPAVYIWEGSIDTIKLQQVFKELINRHESLRTSFLSVANQPVQRIHDDVEFNIATSDLTQNIEERESETPELQQSTLIKKLITKFIRRFDLSSAPLLRVEIIRINYKTNLLALDIHHIISDGTSIQQLIKEFTERYNGQELPPLPLQYNDFTRWQNSLRQGNRIKQQHEYWHKLYSGEIPLLELPYDNPRPKVQSFEGSTVNFIIETKETAAIQQKILKNNSTPFMLMLAIYSIFLAKITNQEDIIIGTPIAGRRHPDFKTIIGMFVNTLALRNFPNGEKSVEHFLKEVQKKTLEAFENQDYQFEDLVETLDLERETSRNPLFEAMLVVQDIPDQEIRLIPQRENSQTITIRPLDIENHVSKFDITLHVEIKEDHMRCTFEYCTRLFQEDTIQRYTDYFKNIVTAILEEENRKLHEIDILSEQERHQLLEQFNTQQEENPTNTTLQQLFWQIVQRTPDRIALIGQSSSKTPINALKNESTHTNQNIQISYTHLHENSCKIASLLSENGIKPGDIVAMVMERSIQMITGILGIVQAGAAYLPIDPGNPPERIDIQLRDSDTTIVISDRNPVGTGHCPVRILDISQTIRNQSYIHKNDEKQKIQQSTTQPPHRLPAYIIYTSGTTGKPKGVLITHSNICPLLHYGYKNLAIGPNDRIVQNLSYNFDWSVWEIFITLTSGAVLHLIPKEIHLNNKAYISFIHKYEITIIHITPTQWQFLLDTGKTVNTLKNLFIGAEKLSLDLVKHTIPLINKDCRIYNMYGPTEATIIASIQEIKTNEIEKETYLSGIPIGKPIANTLLFVLNKYRRPSPLKTAGELFIGGSGVSNGYLNNPELTAVKFCLQWKGGSFQENRPLSPRKSISLKHSTTQLLNYSTLYRTGDWVRWLSDGKIEFIGRIDQQVKIRGNRIEISEIETIIRKHPEIKEAIVVLKEANTGEHYLCAYFISNKTDMLPNNRKQGTIQQNRSATLREFLQDQLPEYMIPSYFMEVNQFPFTSNGKLDKTKLPEPQIEQSTEIIAPVGKIEKQLVEIWARVLGKDEPHTAQLKSTLGRQDNFFHMGGHSLKASILASQINETFHTKIPLTEIFTRQTIRELAKYIEENNERKYISIEPTEKKEYYPLSSAQKRLYFLQQMDPESTAYNMPLVLSLGTGIEIARIEAAFKKLITRHKSLQTSFQKVGDEPVQRIHEEIKFEIEYHSATVDGEVPSPGSFIRPFDLSQAPIIRSSLISDINGNYTWLVDMHHIISDGTSSIIMREDFLSLYSDHQLPLLKIQYKDFSQWQNRLFKSNEIQSQIKYWLNLFNDAGEIPRLEIPTDYTRPEMFNYSGDYYSFSLEKEEIKKLGSTETGKDGTLYMKILAVLNTLFYLYTGQSDIIIGTGIAGRPNSNLHDIMGMFVNTLAMRNRPHPGISFKTLMQQVIDNSIEAFENQDMQFEELVDRLNLERDPSRNPLFDIMMVVQNFQRSSNLKLNKENPTQMGTVSSITEHLSSSPITHTSSKFDMTFFVQEEEDYISIAIEYYTGIFAPETIQRYAQHVTNLVQILSTKPGIKLEEIDILTDREKHELIYEFNKTHRQNPEVKSILDLFARQVDKTPDKIVLTGPQFNIETQIPNKNRFNTSKSSHKITGSITYAELERNSNRYANYLYHEKQLNQEDRIGIYMDKSIERIISVLGVLKSGGAFVPIDPAIPAERIKTIINDAGIQVVISMKQMLRTLNQLQWETPGMHTFLCTDSWEIYNENEEEKNQLMDENLWKYVAETSVDDITAGGWLSSYTGEPISRAEMDQYSDNIFEKLKPFLNKSLRVLEIGCASGISMFRLAPQVGFYYGTDLSGTIIRKNQQRVTDEGIKNIKLESLAAHEIDKIEETDFDLIIINSVIQCFPGHNYLRNVIRKAIKKLKDKGHLFIGDVMDQELKAALISDLEAFKRSNHEKQYTTKTDFSAELFVAKDFFRDLSIEMPWIHTVTPSLKTGSIANELTRYRYDVILTIEKNNAGNISGNKLQKQKYQQDLNNLNKWGDEPLKREIEPKQMAYIIYTSGSTGNPKGVVIQHQSLVNLCEWHNRYYQVTEKDNATQYAGFGFDASVWEVYPYLSTGATIHIIPDHLGLETDRLNEYFETRRITIAFLPTQLCEQFNKENNHSLRALLTGGDKLHSVQKQAYTLHNNYGPTENTVVTTTYPVKPEQVKNINIPIGKPIDNTHIYILKPVNHSEGHLVHKRLQPIGVTGELCIGGTGLARGYLNAPELTAERFVPIQLFSNTHKYTLQPLTIHSTTQPLNHSTLYRTGDLARWQPDGNIQFMGRIDNQVKIRGIRIELGEIENHLLTHEKIKEVVVIDRGKEKGDTYLSAYYIAASPSQIDSKQLSQHLAEKLPAYMIPNYFIEIEKIPLTANGKVNRKALPEPEIQTSGHMEKLQTITEKNLAEIWSDVLTIDIHVIGREANFFAMGGHSLKATVLTSKIHSKLNVKIPLAEIFTHPTLREQALYIDNSSKSNFSSLEKAPEKSYYELSSAQKRLYILQQMDKTSTAYNITSALILKGYIEKEQLQEIFAQLIDRHESLRTAIQLINGEIVQEIIPPENTSFDVQVLSTEGMKQSKEIAGEFIQPFELNRAPLLRVGLIKEKEDQFVLLVDMHHIISDGTSVAIIIREFTALYAGDQLPAQKYRYIDYSERQNRMMVQGELQPMETYWKSRYEKGIPVLNLPVDSERPTPRSYEGKAREFGLTAEETSNLQNIATQQGATLFMVIQAIYAIFLSKLSGQDDIVIGTPVAGRTHSDLQNTIGMFVNTLALRNHLHQHQTFTKILKEVKKETLSAIENQDYPFETLVEKLNIIRDLSRNPLFDVMFEMQNMEIPEIHLPGLEVAPYPMEIQTAQFDITLSAVEKAGTLTLFFKYCTKLFNDQTITRYITYIRQLITSLIADPFQTLAQIDILPEEERQKLLIDFNATEATYPEDKLIHQLFEIQVEKTPDRIALTGQEELNKNLTIKQSGEPGTAGRTTETVQLSYSEFNHQANELSRQLIENGAGSNSIIAIMIDRSIPMMTAIYGTIKAGAAYLPISPLHPEERKEYMLRDSGTKILITANEKHQSLPGEIENILQIYCRGLIHQAQPTNPKTKGKINPSNLVYIIYTSGTTGKPKGVLIQHGSLVNRLNWMQKAYPLDATDTILHKTPYTFDVSVWEIFWWGQVGANVSLLEPGGEKSPETILQAIIKNHVTVMHFVPSMLALFLEYLSQNPKTSPISSLKQVIASGEALTVNQVKAFKETLHNTTGVKLANLYGPTEASIDVSYFNCYAPGQDIPGNIPIGKPIDNIHLYILDNQFRNQPIGVIGELMIAGKGLARGYLNRPEMTNEKFCHLPKEFYSIKSSKALQSTTQPLTYTTIYRTGDLARWNREGHIEYIGRIDQQVKIRGNRIELEEIENRLMHHQSVKEAVVICTNGTGAAMGSEKSLCACIVSTNELNVTEMREYLTQWLPEYMVPSVFKQVEHIPLSANGKVDRNALAGIGTRLSVKTQYAPPGTRTQIKIANIWNEILQLKETKVGIQDNFFDLGGTSMDVIRVNARINLEFSQEIPIVSFYKYTTVYSLANLIDQGETREHQLYPEEKRVERVQQGRSDKNKMRELRRRGRQ